MSKAPAGNRQNNSSRGAPKKRQKHGAPNMERFLSRVYSRQHPLIAARKLNHLVGRAGHNYSGAKQ